MKALVSDFKKKLAVERKFSTGETERTELKYMEKQHVKQFELNELMKQCDEKDEEIRDVRAELCKNEDQIHKMNSVIDGLQSEIGGLHCELEQKQSCITESGERLNKIMEDYGKLEEKLTETSKSLAESQSSQLLLKEKFETNQCTYTEEGVGTRDFPEDNGTLDILTMEKSEVESKIQEMFGEKTAMLQEKEMLVMEKASLTAEIGELSSELAKYKGENFDHQAKFQDIRKLYAEKMDASSAQSEELAKISKMLDDERKVNENLHLKIQEDEELILSLNSAIDNNKAEINQLKKEVKSLSKKEKVLQSQIEKLKEAEKQYEEKLENVQKELEIALEENEALKSEKEEQDKNLNGELETMSKETGKLEQKMRSLKDDLSAKNKHSKELEKEIRSLKSKLTSQTKANESRDKEIEELTGEKDKCYAELQELQAACEELRVNMEKEKNFTKDAKKEVKDMKKQFDDMLKEKEVTEKRCEHEIQELMSTMEKFHQTNGKLVEDKDKEIENLKKEISKHKDLSKSENDAAVLELQNEMEQMQSLLNTSNESVKSLQRENGDLHIRVKKFEDSIDKNNAEKENKDYKAKLRRFENDLHDKESEIQELMTKINDLKVEKREPNSSLKLKKKSNGNQSIKENVPSTPTVSTVSYEDEAVTKVSNIKMTPKVLMCTTPKYTPSSQKKQNIKRPSPTANKTATPMLAALKTPQRSILKAESGNSIVKKRRVVFASDDENGSDSSSSEMMEVEINEIQSRLKSTTPKKTPLLLKPSPRVKTPDRTLESESDDDSDDNYPRNPKQLALNRVPRASAATNQTASSEKSQNIRKAPSKPQGKFFLTSPKERLKNQKKNSKLAKLKRTEDSWFEMDSIFGFED
uniref:Laminin subunit alpha-2 n=1 Tax=Magallana gigas TaxID=29159 RepID=K1RB25_MAGGI